MVSVLVDLFRPLAMAMCPTHHASLDVLGARLIAQIAFLAAIVAGSYSSRQYSAILVQRTHLLSASCTSKPVTTAAVITCSFYNTDHLRTSGVW